jgi:hypothetical protein
MVPNYSVFQVNKAYSSILVMTSSLQACQADCLTTKLPYLAYVQLSICLSTKMIPDGFTHGLIITKG